MQRLYRKPAAQQDLFATDRTFLERAKKRAGVLNQLHKLFPFESYRSQITNAINTYRVAHGGKSDKKLCRSGRRPMDPVFMLKCIVAQRLFGKADKDFEQEMLQNIVLQDWLGINYPSDVPSHKTIWKYKEIFAQTEVLETVFSDYVNKLQAINSKVGTEAVIADSSFVEAPKQRNTRQENALIKKGKGHTLWNDHPNKKRHKDIDASWTKKTSGSALWLQGTLSGVRREQAHCQSFKVHDANAKVLEQYLPWAKHCGKSVLFFADAGYKGKEIEDKLLNAGLPPLICEKGKKGAPLTAKQKKSNKQISTIRSRIEHVFGFIEESLGGSIVRSIGMVRAKFNITLTSLVYNICRLGQLARNTA